MIGFFSQLISMSVQAALIITLVALCRFILIKCGVPRKFIMLLWIIPFFFMVCPWKISVPQGFLGNVSSYYEAEDIAQILYKGPADATNTYQMGNSSIIIAGETGGISAGNIEASGSDNAQQSAADSNNLREGMSVIDFVPSIMGSWRYCHNGI